MVGKNTKMKNTTPAIPLRPFGKTGEQVSALCLGGSHLGETKDEKIALRIVDEAIAGGVTFMDNAWDYHDGMSERRMGKALKGKRDQVFLMTKVCTHGRDKKAAMRMLEESLKRLQTDHLDLWQIHEVVYFNDPDLIFARNGVIEALELAQKQGKVRYIGFTGHKHPELHLRMLNSGFPFDSCQMPLNPYDANFRSFENEVVPEAVRRGVSVIGMKSMGGDGIFVKKGDLKPEEALSYAMSLPVVTTVSGIDSLAVLKQNLAVAQGFNPLSKSKMEQLRKRCRANAADGRFELYKISIKYEGKEGRQQHNFPTEKELAA